jgi:protein tyrosine phosphatase
MTIAAAGVTPSTRPTTTPHTSRTPYSVGQSLPNPRFTPQSTQHAARTPSPNYFGLTVDPSIRDDPLSSGGGQHARKNWSPPTSNVRSTAAASPRIIPLDQNPEFDAFRRASEANGYSQVRMSSFSMGGLPNVRRTSSKSGSISHTIPLSPSQIMLPPSPKTTVPGYGHRITDTKQKSPKRMLSSPASHVTDRPRRNSPAGFNERDASLAPQVARFLEQEDRDTRHSMPPVNSAPPPPTSLHQRADTLPGFLDDQVTGNVKDGAPALVSPQYVQSLMQEQPNETLILDVRVSTQYAKSRIKGALNLCIPTTLLKRPAYKTNKLSDTFKVEEQRAKFDSWRGCKTIVVYDTNSTKMKDAGPCLKMLEKFENEGWNGASCIIRGGFVEFSRKFPSSTSSGFHTGSSVAVSPGGGLAPVIGGCPMPHTENAANPFFSNIRQNMDLIGGVGQLALQRPAAMTNKQKEELPRWLKRAISSSNEGKMVSDKFLHIEQKEQKRMRDAMSHKVNYGTPRTADEEHVQLAGIEKGAKNRYNNIWPYEHSRVKLEGALVNGCDYVNANYVKSQWSNKRYIATQGPIPATFGDFWNVVWQQDVRVVVMLTAETEGGQLKAHNYWQSNHYGSIHVHLHSEHRASLEPARIRDHRSSRPSAMHRHSTTSSRSSTSRDSDGSENLNPNSDKPYVIVRNITISNSAEPFARMREITQLHYTGWPDFGAPAHPSDLLGLVEQCDAVVRASSSRRSLSEPALDEERPVLVHCSAGCGRTGTFCTVDSVLDMLKRQIREGYLNPHDHESQRSARQPTPMDLDSRSRQTSFSTASSPTMTHAERSFFQSKHVGVEAKVDEWMDRDDVDLVEKAVSDFRLQRLSMVQSLRQYVLCYESVLEWLIGQGLTKG